MSVSSVTHCFICSSSELYPRYSRHESCLHFCCSEQRYSTLDLGYIHVHSTLLPFAAHWLSPNRCWYRGDTIQQCEIVSPHKFVDDPSLFDVTLSLCLSVLYRAGRWGGLGGLETPLLKFRRPSKIVPNWTRLWKLLKICWIKTPTH
jgi:hypothetical protein